MRRTVPAIVRVALLLPVAALGQRAAFAQAAKLTPEQAAMMVLDAARRAYNEGRHAFAAQQFRKFLQSHGGHKEAPGAWYGLGMSLLDAPQKDYQGAVAALKNVIGRPDFPERPFAIYYMGVASRGLGAASLAKAAAEPAQASSHRTYAKRYFDEAAQHFAAATDAFIARAKATAATTAPAKGAESSGRLWSARARCDWCDMLLRAGKFKQTATLAKAFLDDKTTGKGPFRGRTLYYLGYARFAMKDYLGAGRALSRLAPFAQEYGDHARYLLARAHHLSGEGPEAAGLYKALLTGYQRAKAAAIQAMRNPRALTPDQKRRAEALIAGPPPDHIVRASFYAALLLAESGRLSDALAGFTSFARQYPKNPLAVEAQLRQGYCHLQLRSYTEAVKALAPLRTHKGLSDRATWWLARARVGGASPADAKAYAQTLKTAMDELNRAASLAYEMARFDPRARVRRGDILMELGDTQQLARQYKQAAATYQRVLSERYDSACDEQALQRMATALHLDGQYSQSDQACDSFEKKYPKSTLLPVVWFRKAENACLAAVAASASRYRPRRQDVERRFEEAIDRYGRVLEKFPDFALADLARYGKATAQYQLGRYTEAAATLSAIPEINRTGELAPVVYLMADCHIRTLPEKTDDALAAAKLIDRANKAAKLLEGYVTAQPKDPQTPDALLKLGYCYQRIGAVLADAAEKKKAFTQARQAYERLLQQFGSDPLAPAGVFERAKCMVMLGDTQTAADDLARFRRDPYRAGTVAPLALVRLSSLLRAQKRPVEAAWILQEYCTHKKLNIRQSSARGSWTAQLYYEHALAMKDSGKITEARTMFESIAQFFPGRPEAANAAWRAGQCRREELTAALAASRKLAAQPGATQEQLSAAAREVDRSLRDLYQVADRFKTRAEAFGKSMKGSKPHLRMLYETAWCRRALGDREAAAARQKLQQQALSRLQSRLRSRRKGRPRPEAPLNPPMIPLRDIPLQPSEKLARGHYADLIAAAPEAPLAVQARFELAELLARRDKNVEAIELLETALESNPPKELAQRIRLRLAASLLGENDPKGAMAQIRLVPGKPTGDLSGEVRYLTGEAYIQKKDWAKAIEQLLPFSNRDPFRSMSGIADRALLRLGHAYAQAGRWEESRRAMETMGHFPRSPWIHEARYGLGWAWQNQKRYDQAVNTYSQVTQQTAGEVAARAQLQIGLCRLAQKRYPEAAAALLIVGYTYDYPDCAAEAWCQAARAHLEMKKPDEAAKLWKRVIKDYPSSKWAKVASQELARLK